MFVPLPSLTDKKGGRMNGVMNHRSGGGLQKMIMRTVINRFLSKNACYVKNNSYICH